MIIDKCVCVTSGEFVCLWFTWTLHSLCPIPYLLWLNGATKYRYKLAAIWWTVYYSTVLRSLKSLARQQRIWINSCTDVGSIEHGTDCLICVSYFDIIFRQRNFILTLTMQQLAWTLDWLCQIGYFLWRQVWRKQSVSLHLLLSMEMAHLNILIIVSESLVSLTSCFNKETHAKSSSFTLYISSLEHSTD